MKAFIISPTSSPHNKNIDEWNIIIDQIKFINPDTIIIYSPTECKSENIFEYFLCQISTYLQEHDKLLYIVTPNSHGEYIANNIVTEISYGNLVSVWPEFLKYTNNKALLSNTSWKYIYMNLNNRYADHRFSLVNKILSNQLQPFGLITLNQLEDRLNLKKRKVFFYTGNIMHNKSFSKDNIAAKLFPENYETCFMDLVSETHAKPNEYHVTEKTLKPIAHLKPFLVNTCARFHQTHLKNYWGFKLYDEIFDYEFDDIDDLELRQRFLLKNIRRLAKMSSKQLTGAFQKIVPKMLYNKNLATEILHDKNKIVPDCMKFLFEPDKHTILGPTSERLYDLMYDMGWTHGQKINIESIEV